MRRQVVGQVLGAWVAVIMIMGLGLWVATAEPEGTSKPTEQVDAARAVATHNRLRASVGAPPLVWDPKLATFAQEWADELKRRGCDLKHRPRQGGFSQRYGENLYWGSAVLFADGRRRSASTTTLEKVILGWASERAFYDANNHTCASGKACGHYTQIVWSATKRVGCGWAKCEDLSQVWVCNYDPPGNVLGRRPF